MNINLYSNFPILTVLLPFIFSIIIVFFVKEKWGIQRKLKYIVSIIVVGILTMSFLLVSMLRSVLKGKIFDSIFWPQMIAFELSFQVDGLSIILAILVFVLWVAVFIYSISYIKANVVRYYTLLLLVLGSVQDTIFAGDLVNFYIFLEITTIVTYFLITHNEDNVALKAGYKYLLMLLGGAFLILLSILFAYKYTGNYNMSSIITCGNTLVPILFIGGCFLKAGAVPLHIWLPDAHPAAPSPISAFLSGIMIKIGAYGLIRVIFPFINFAIPIANVGNFLSMIIMFVAIISMFIGVFLALTQTDVKRLLAYHSISQMGYILFGIGLGTNLGIAGGLFHIINHAIFKGLLFLSMGAVIFRVGSKKLDKMGGLWEKMPVTATICIIAALSISGMPPFNGFASKIVLGKAAGEFNVFLKYILTLASAFTFASFFKLIKYTFFGKQNKELGTIQEAPLLMIIPMVILSFICIFLGLGSSVIMNNLIPLALNKPASYQMFGDVVFWTERQFFDALLTIVLGLIVYFTAHKIGFIGKDNQSIIYDSSLVKLFNCVSADSFYCDSASIVEKICQKLNRLHSRDLNMHLSWIPLTLLIVYLIVSLNFF